MKKFFIVALAAMSLAVVSCKKETAENKGENATENAGGKTSWKDKASGLMDKAKGYADKAKGFVGEKVNLDKITSDPKAALDAATNAVKNKDMGAVNGYLK